MSGAPDELASVVTDLESDIIFGRLLPGQRLVEDTLMARFSATRHTIRQALAELDRVGIVKRERNIGASVQSYGRAEVLQIYQVRELLQRQAALMIPLPVSPGLVAELETLNGRFEQEALNGNLRGVHESNDQFHLTLFAACGNSYLAGSIADYMALSLPIRATTLSDAKLFQVSLSQHRAMIAMVQDTDRWALAQLCVEHVWPSKQDYLQRAPVSEANASAALAHLQSRTQPRRRTHAAMADAGAGERRSEGTAHSIAE